MCGVANAIFWMCGKAVSDKLLLQYIPLTVDCWQTFVTQVRKVVPYYSLRRFKCQNVLLADNTFPMVVQLRSRDMSESHSVCIYQNCIYDSASRYVLTKTKETLEWCCGTAGFHSHLRLYQFHQFGLKSPPSDMKKKRSRYT